MGWARRKVYNEGQDTPPAPETNSNDSYYSDTQTALDSQPLLTLHFSSLAMSYNDPVQTLFSLIDDAFNTRSGSQLQRFGENQAPSVTRPRYVTLCSTRNEPSAD